MIQDIKRRLTYLHCTVADTDAWMLDMSAKKAENHIKDFCNVRAVPDELKPIAIDMAAGEFLFIKKSSGTLAGINIDAAVKQIQEGDTSIAFAIGTGDLSPEGRLDALISYLMNSGSDQLLSHRCISW